MSAVGEAEGDDAFFESAPLPPRREGTSIDDIGVLLLVLGLLLGLMTVLALTSGSWR